jgi:hypothetical protein
LIQKPDDSLAWSLIAFGERHPSNERTRNILLSLTNPSNPCVIAIWRYAGTGKVKTTPDHYIEIPSPASLLIGPIRALASMGVLGKLRDTGTNGSRRSTGLAVKAIPPILSGLSSTVGLTAPLKVGESLPVPIAAGQLIPYVWGT